MYLFSILPEGFKELTLASSESYAEHDCLLWTGKSKLETWKTPPLEWLEDEFTSATDPVPDIASVAGTIALSEKAYKVLKDHLDGQVEFLNTTGPGPEDKWFLLNVSNVLNIMEPAKSKYKIYDDGKIGMCEHGYLNEPSLDNRIFQVKDYFSYIFVNGEIKDAIETAGLTGALIREYINP